MWQGWCRRSLYSLRTMLSPIVPWWKTLQWSLGRERSSLALRTNDDGISALAATFEGIPVVPIEVPESLHLKTVLSSVGLNILAIEDTTEEKSIFSAIQICGPIFQVHHCITSRSC